MLRSLKIWIAGRVWRFFKYWGEEVQFHQMASILADYRRQGVRIGKDVVIFHSNLDAIYPELISIGDDVTITNSTIITHSDAGVLWLKKRQAAPVTIGNRVFIGWNTTILPGVTIGDDVIVGAGSVVTKSIPPRTIAAGVPAVPIKSLDDYLASLAVNKTVVDFTLGSNTIQRGEELAMRERVRQMYLASISNQPHS